MEKLPYIFFFIRDNDTININLYEQFEKELRDHEKLHCSRNHSITAMGNGKRNASFLPQYYNLYLEERIFIPTNSLGLNF